LQRLSTCATSANLFWDSGFEHHGQRNGHPFTKTVVLMPAPSCTLNRWILKITPGFTVLPFYIAVVFLSWPIAL
jgi:hypothetical protein